MNGAETSLALCLRGVDKRYGTGATAVNALKAIDLDVQPGEFVALAGPSGSGKSTLLNICGLLDRCDGGSYRLAGQEVRSLSERALTHWRREKIGFIFQSFNLIPTMSAYENTEYPLLLQGVPAAERRGRVERIFKRVALWEQRRQRPDQLSGGQRQRVAIARALVKNPILLIADEPTANLDTATATCIIDVLHELTAEYRTTVLVATHDARMTSRCERVVHLTDGRLP